jgi:acyl-CoA thioester hydrolase
MSAVQASGGGEFSWLVRVYYEDTDLSGVVYHANYLKFLERARTEWLRALGFSQDRLLQDYGIAFTLVDIEVAFRKPARLDDALVVTVQLERLKRASFELSQRIDRTVEGSRTTLTTARAQVACVDAAAFKPRALPVDIASSIAGRYPAPAVRQN